MTDRDHSQLFELISELVMCHSPSGLEQEVDAYLTKAFADRGLATTMDAGGNVIAKIEGRGGGAIAITGHKDEIAAIVTSIEPDGRVRVKKLGGSFPWIYGEGVVDLLGDHRVISGILSFGSRHVSHASPQFTHKETAPVKWADVWIHSMLTCAELEAAGVRPGTRMVVGKHRKTPYRLNNHIASYTLDDKAALAILLGLSERIRDPLPDVYLVATSKEEVGAVGALYFTQQRKLDALIALEIAPIAPEYSIVDSEAPVLFVEDSFGLYDEGLNAALRSAASRRQIALQLAAVNGFGSDASIAMKEGHVPRAACLAFATHNTHGYEISHMGAISNCVDVLTEICAADVRSAAPFGV